MGQSGTEVTPRARAAHSGHEAVVQVLAAAERAAQQQAELDHAHQEAAEKLKAADMTKWMAVEHARHEQQKEQMAVDEKKRQAIMQRQDETAKARAKMEHILAAELHRAGEELREALGRIDKEKEALDEAMHERSIAHTEYAALEHERCIAQAVYEENVTTGRKLAHEDMEAACCEQDDVLKMAGAVSAEANESIHVAHVEHLQRAEYSGRLVQVEVEAELAAHKEQTVAAEARAERTAAEQAREERLAAEVDTAPRLRSEHC
jgi:hypothetical protein